MKTANLLLSALFIWISLDTFAQKKLTNREIYNFEIGDIIHTSYTHQYPPIYVKRLFVSKNLSANQDTLFYDVLDSVYILVNIPNWSFRVENNKVKYIKLDSFPKPFDQNFQNNSTFPLSYQAHIDTCGFVNNTLRFTNAPDTMMILDREYYDEYCYEGLGKYVSHQYQNNTRLYYELLYFKKGGQSCGKPIDVLGIAQPHLKHHLTIYPNPAIHHIAVKGIEQGFYEIYDLYGKLVLSGNMQTSIPIAAIDKGVYNLQIMSENKLYTSKFIKE